MADDPKALFAELLSVARELARLATMPGNPPPYSIGTQVARLREIEETLLKEEHDPGPE